MLALPFESMDLPAYVPRIRYVRQFVLEIEFEREHRYDAIATDREGNEAQLYVELQERDDVYARQWLRAYAARHSMVLVDPNHARSFKLALPRTVTSEYV